MTEGSALCRVLIGCRKRYAPLHRGKTGALHQVGAMPLRPPRTAMSLEQQLADIARVPMLTCDEEIILGTRVQKMLSVLRENGIDEQISKQNFSGIAERLDENSRRVLRAGLKARDRMISANMRLVVAVAKKIKTSQMHMTIQDMIQEGAIGLARAAEKFEPGRGYKFSTYAYWWIRQGITRASENQEKAIRTPASVQKMAKQIKFARDELVIELKKEPTIKEIATKIGEESEKVERIAMLDSIVISLDSGIKRHEESSELLELISSSSDQEDENENNEKIEIILRLLHSLPEDEELLIRQRYGIGMAPLSTKDMADANGISEQMIKQKQLKITKKMRYVASIFIVN